MRETVAFPLVIVAVTVLLGVSLAIWLIVTMRRQSFLHWYRPARWGFIACAAFFTIFGAGLWIARWFTVHWLAGVFQFVIVAIGLRAAIMALPEPSASPETPRPPQAF